MNLIIKNLIILGTILGAAFVSQQPFLRGRDNNYLYVQNLAKNNDNLKNGSLWLKNSLAGVLGQGSGEEVKNKASDVLKNAGSEIEKQKNNIVENSFTASKNFIAEKLLQMLHVNPEDLGSCKAN